MPRTDFFDKFDDYYVFHCGIVDEHIGDHINERIKPKKEKNRIFNKKSIKIFVNNISEYYGEMFTDEHLILWVIHRFGYENAKKLVHYRLFLKFRKKNEIKEENEKADVPCLV